MGISRLDRKSMHRVLTALRLDVGFGFGSGSPLSPHWSRADRACDYVTRHKSP